MASYLIETDRLRLRRFAQTDFDEVYAMFNDPEVMRFYPRVRDREATQAWFDWVFESYDRYGHCFWAVERRGDGRLLGPIGCLYQEALKERSDIEVGYMLARHAWGHGYATEAALACRTYAFEVMKPDRVVSYIAPDNERSIAVAQRSGMQMLARVEPDENKWKKAILVYGIYGGVTSR